MTTKTRITRSNLHNFKRFEVINAGHYSPVGGIYELDFDDSTTAPLFRWVEGPMCRLSNRKTYLNLSDIVGLSESINMFTTAATQAPSKIVVFNMTYRVGTGLIDLIKVFRTATGAGLKESKDVVDAARAFGARGIRMTEKQFGRFLAEVLASTNVSLADVRMDQVSIVDANFTPPAFDFTRNAG